MLTYGSNFGKQVKLPSGVMERYPTDGFVIRRRGSPSGIGFSAFL
jgi:hypothetical protein